MLIIIPLGGSIDKSVVSTKLEQYRNINVKLKPDIG